MEDDNELIEILLAWKNLEAGLWRMLNETMFGGFRIEFGTAETTKVRNITPEIVRRWLQQRRTLGGYLCSLRDMRELEVAECAALTGVGEERWSAWEAGDEVPSPEELDTILERMELGERTRKALFRLRGEALEEG